MPIGVRLIFPAPPKAMRRCSAARRPGAECIPALPAERFRDPHAEEGAVFLTAHLPEGAPAVLVERGFLSNPEEEAKLQSPAYLTELVDALVRAVIRFKNQMEAREATLRTPDGRTPECRTTGGVERLYLRMRERRLRSRRHPDLSRGARRAR